MQQVDTRDEIEEQIKQNELLLLYFTGTACGACEVIKHKVEMILEKYPEVKGIEVNGEQFPQVAMSYGVYALPLMILFVQGKESIREGRNLNLLEFEEKVARYVSML
ncbi:MAG: thioredoxin family protein [Niameybacter sp.]|uniref:thioredoxin family protein n=1 Tax=Niameybacter sp. TaxID=2033640 RepID=UPI002FC9CBA1